MGKTTGTSYNTVRHQITIPGTSFCAVVDPERVVFDSNLQPHHHLYDTDTGELTDVPFETMQVVGLPTLPPGAQLQQIDVIVRMRGRRNT